MPAVWVPKVPKVAQPAVAVPVAVAVDVDVAAQANGNDSEPSISRTAMLGHRPLATERLANYHLLSLTDSDRQAREMAALLVPPGLFPAPGLMDNVDVDKYSIFKPVAKEELAAVLKCLSTSLDQIADNFEYNTATSSLNEDLFEPEITGFTKILKATSESDLSTVASSDEAETETLSPRSETKDTTTSVSDSPHSDEEKEKEKERALGLHAVATEATEVATEFVDPLADWLTKLAARPLWQR